MAQHSRLAYRASLRERSWWLVDKLLPGNTIHTLVGGSGSGKTTWLLQQLYEWEKGNNFLGYKSHPCPWTYVSLDRKTWETDKTLTRIGLGPELWDPPIFGMTDLEPNAYTNGFTIETILMHPWFKDVKLFVIEGLQMLLPDTKAGQSQNKVEMMWMNQVADRLFANGQSIIAVTHNPKMKRGETFTSGRANMLGSVSIGASSSTMITVDKVHQEPTDDAANSELDQRIVTLDGRDFKAFSILYDIDNRGTFVNPQYGATPSAVKESSYKADIMSGNLDIWLMSLPAVPMKSSEMQSYATAQGISRATMYRWIESALARKILKQIGHGLYLKDIDNIDAEASTLAPEGAPAGNGGLIQ